MRVRSNSRDVLYLRVIRYPMGTGKMSLRKLVWTCGVMFFVGEHGLLGQDASPVANGLRSDAVDQDASTLNVRPTSPAIVRQGRQNFRAVCSRCHGRDARGGKGPDLTDGVFRHARTDDDILRILAVGIPGTGMVGTGLGFDDFNWPIVAYLREEEGKRALVNEPLSGNTARGKELFAKHKCATCHWTGSEGGRLGTDLARLTSTPDYVRESLTAPNGQIDGSHQSLQIVTDSGEVLTGRRLYENTFHVLLMDEKENLSIIPKEEIEVIQRPQKSLMPTFSGTLSPADVEDLTAYIFSIQVPATP